MSYDPCIQCGEQTGIGSDNMEILVDGDAPPVTLCSYRCLKLWAQQKYYENQDEIRIDSTDKPDGYTMIEDSEP